MRKAVVAVTLVLGLAALGAGTGVILWKQGIVRNWLQTKIAPIEIEELEIHRPLQLSATLRYKNWRARLQGPIRLRRKITATAVLEAVRPEGIAASSPLDLTFEGGHFSAKAQEWCWPGVGVQLSQLDLQGTIRDNGPEATLTAQTARWKQTPSRLIELKALLVHGDERGAQAYGAQARAQWDRSRWDLNQHRPALSVAARYENDLELTVDAGPLHAQTQAGILTWKSDAIPIDALSRSLSAIIQLPAGLETKGGTIESEGRLDLSRLTAKRPLKASGTFRIRGGGIRSRRLALVVSGIEATGSFSAPFALRARAKAQHILFKKARGTLEATRIELGNGGEFLVGGLNKNSPIPLRIEGIPATIGALTGRVSGIENDWALETSLKLPPISVDKLTQPFCFNKRIPPATIEADLAQISLASGIVEPDGKITAHLFDGEIQVQDMGLFDLGTEAPETDFDVTFAGIQLHKLCEWSGFGEVLGSLQGFAHDVTFQGWLPTHFDFSLDAVPLAGHSTIELDPEAMYNLVSLFAGDALAHVPIVAHEGWFNRIFDPYFGWLSRRLGGFDLRYLGLSLFSDGGTILLETHDPPAIYERLKKHHVFWGRRFSMPIQSPRYPVVMDETGIARIFQYMVKRAELIAKLKREREGTADPKTEDPTECLPEEFSSH